VSGIFCTILYVFTFDSKFYKSDTIGNKKKILVDEVFQTPKRWMEYLLRIKMSKPDIKFQLYGDPLQCHGVECENGKSGKWFDYQNTYLLYKLCDGNLYNLEYSKNSRFDKKLKDEIDYFKKHKQLSNNWISKKKKPNLKTNITKYNITADSINKVIGKHFGYEKYMCIENHTFEK